MSFYVYVVRYGAGVEEIQLAAAVEAADELGAERVA